MVFELLHVVACRLEAMHKNKQMTRVTVPCVLLKEVIHVKVDFLNYYRLRGRLFGFNQK
jgi:hypothetical protein